MNFDIDITEDAMAALDRLRECSNSIEQCRTDNIRLTAESKAPEPLKWSDVFPDDSTARIHKLYDARKMCFKIFSLRGQLQAMGIQCGDTDFKGVCPSMENLYARISEVQRFDIGFQIIFRSVAHLEGMVHGAKMMKNRNYRVMPEWDFSIPLQTTADAVHVGDGVVPYPYIKPAGDFPGDPMWK